MDITKEEKVIVTGAVIGWIILMWYFLGIRLIM